MLFPSVISTEEVPQSCSLRKVFLKILQNLQENTCARLSFFKKVAIISLQLY